MNWYLQAPYLNVSIMAFIIHCAVFNFFPKALKNALTLINPCKRCAIIEKVTERKLSTRFDEIMQNFQKLQEKTDELQRESQREIQTLKQNAENSQREIQKLKQNAVVSQRKTDDSQRKADDSQWKADYFQREIQKLKQNTDDSQREIHKLKQNAVVSQRKADDLQRKTEGVIQKLKQTEDEFQEKAFASQSEISILKDQNRNMLKQVTHITSVYVVSYQAILRRSLLHNARKSICKEMDKEPLRDLVTGYLKWNQALQDILASPTASWEGRKFTRANVQFIIANSSTGNSNAHPDIEESVIPLAYSVTTFLDGDSLTSGFVDLFCRCLPGQDPYTVVRQSSG